MVVNNYFTNYFRSLNLGRNFLQESFSSKKVSTTTTKSLQSCPTLCSPMDCSLPGFSIHGILQARTLEGLPLPSPTHESETEVAQSCPTLCSPMDCSLPGFSIHGIFQARVLEWVAYLAAAGTLWRRSERI